MSSIKLKNVSLDYPIYGSSPRMFTRKILSIASAGAIKYNDKYQYIKGLDNISIELKAGDRLGIIGGNGAGKSTLLKTIAGIYEPTKGSVKIDGKITSLISSGLGMDDDSTGYQNIVLSGISIGYSKKEMESRFKDIEEFTELGDFLNLPIKTYSAGMRLRLAFAIATSVEPEIIVIDEGIGAGDAEFYSKAVKRVESFLSKASILIIASHSDDLLLKFCNKGIWMANGQIIDEGNMKELIKRREQKN